jgi:hypothetical protein
MPGSGASARAAPTIANSNVFQEMSPMREHLDDGDRLRDAAEAEPAPEIDPVEQASWESFPASDPPSWEPLHSGSPANHETERERDRG